MDKLSIFRSERSIRCDLSAFNVQPEFCVFTIKNSAHYSMRVVFKVSVIRKSKLTVAEFVQSITDSKFTEGNSAALLIYDAIP